jgi:hypothetical protein
MAQATSGRTLNADAWDRYEDISSWMYCGHNEVL